MAGEGGGDCSLLPSLVGWQGGEQVGVAGEREGGCSFHLLLVEWQGEEQVVAAGVDLGGSRQDLVVTRVERSILEENCKVQFLPKTRDSDQGLSSDQKGISINKLGWW